MDNQNKILTIKNILKEATINRWPYPKTLTQLDNAGLITYQVIIGDNYKATFKSSFGIYDELHLEGYIPLTPALTFSAENIKTAIIEHITKQTSYLDFITKIASFGVWSYEVDVQKRTVTYFNRLKTEQYQEAVPAYAD